MQTGLLGSADISAQVPYWVAVLTPDEPAFGMRRTDPCIDTVDSTVTTSTHFQWTAADAPSFDSLLAVLASTVGAWRSDRCRNSPSGVLVDISSGDPTSLFPVRLPTSGELPTLTAEARRRIASTPDSGSGYSVAKHTFASRALSRKSGAQIAFHYGADHPTPDGHDPLQHSLTVSCRVVEADGISLVDTEFRWNCSVFTRADVDDFERFWEKSIALV